MHCYHCSSVAGANAAFCGKCGAQLSFTEDIILAAIAKEEQAITYLYTETYNSVFQVIRPLIKDEDTALDILQDAYIKAFESLAQLEKPEQFRAWVKRIAQNKSKDWLKKKKPTLFSEMRPDDEGGEIDFLDDREFAQPDVIMDKKETRRLLWDIIDSLSDEQRLVVSMFYFQEMQVKEIAAELDTSENTVKSRLNYARKHIETKVLALEKKGTKLYSLAPLPFLLWLIRSGAETPSAATLTEITGSLGATGSTAAAASSGATATSAAATSGTAATGAAAGASIVTKIIVGIVTAAIAIGGGALLYQALTPDDEPTEIVSQLDEAQDVADVTAEIEADVIPEPEPTPSPEPTPDLEALNAERIAAFVELMGRMSSGYMDMNRFVLHDVDGDGLYELLMTIRVNEDMVINAPIFTGDDSGKTKGIFGYGHNGGRVPLVSYSLVTYQGEQYLAYASSDNNYSTRSPEFYLYGKYLLLRPKDGSLETAFEIDWSYTSNFETGDDYDISATSNGNAMSEDEFMQLHESSVSLFEDAMSYDEFMSKYKKT